MWRKRTRTTATHRSKTRPARATGLEHPGWQRPLSLGFICVSLMVAGLMLWIYWGLLEAIFWAAAFAVLVYPAHRFVLRQFGGRRNLAAIASSLLWLAIVATPSFFAVTEVVRETRELWPRLLALFGGGFFESAAHWLQSLPFKSFVYVAFEIPENASSQDLQALVRHHVESFAEFLLSGLRKLTLSAPAALFSASITFITFVFLLRQGEELVHALKALLPLHPARADAFVQTMGMSIHAVFRGVLLTALTQGALAAAGFTFFGAPVPMLLGFLTFVAALIPVVGAAAVWLPTAACLYLVGNVQSAMLLAIWGTCVVSLADNVLRPLFIRRGIRLPFLWLFLTLVGGLQTFGLLGLFLAPATLAVYLGCYRIYMQDRRGRHDTRDPAETPPEAQPEQGQASAAERLVEALRDKQQSQALAVRQPAQPDASVALQSPSPSGSGMPVEPKT